MEITTIYSGDIILAKIGVGTLPPRRAESFIISVRESLQKYFQNEIITIAIADSRNTTLEILRRGYVKTE